MNLPTEYKNWSPERQGEAETPHDALGSMRGLAVGVGLALFLVAVVLIVRAI